MRQILITLILLIVFSINIIASDSLIYDTTYKYTQEDVDSIIQNELVDKSNYSVLGQILKTYNLKGWEWFYLKEGRAKYYELKFDEAEDLLKKSIQIIDSSDITKQPIGYKCRIEANIALAHVFQQTRQIEKATVFFQKALDDTEFYPYKHKTSITAGIAGNHYFLGNDSIAYVLMKEVSQDTDYMSLPKYGIFVWNALAALNQGKENQNAAIDNFKNGLALGDKTDFHTYDQTLCMNLVDIYWDLDSMELVEYYLKRAIKSYELYDQLQRPYKAEFNKKAIGTLKIITGKIDEGIQLLQEIVDTVKFNGVLNKSDRFLVGNCYSIISKGYAEQGNYDKALETLRKKVKLEKTFGEFLLNQQVQKLEIEYQAKEKDRSISMLTDQTIEQSATIYRQKQLVAGVGILMGLLAVIGFLIYRQRTLAAKYKEANLQQRLLRTQMDPHFIFNSLNSVSSLIYQKSEMAIPYVSNLASLLRLILENSREELIPLKDEITALENYLSLESNFGMKFIFSIDTSSIDINELLAPPMLIQPFVENAVHHAFNNIQNPEIALSIIKHSDNNLLVKINDNGVGLTKSKTSKSHNSVSTSIVRERLALFSQHYKVKCDLQVSEVAHGGTSVRLTIPYIAND